MDFAQRHYHHQKKHFLPPNNGSPTLERASTRQDYSHKQLTNSRSDSRVQQRRKSKTRDDPDSGPNDQENCLYREFAAYNTYNSKSIQGTHNNKYTTQLNHKTQVHEVRPDRQSDVHDMRSKQSDFQEKRSRQADLQETRGDDRRYHDRVEQERKLEEKLAQNNDEWQLVTRKSRRKKKCRTQEPEQDYQPYTKPQLAVKKLKQAARVDPTPRLPTQKVSLQSDNVRSYASNLAPVDSRYTTDKNHSSRHLLDGVKTPVIDYDGRYDYESNRQNQNTRPMLKGINKYWERLFDS